MNFDRKYECDKIACIRYGKVIASRTVGIYYYAAVEKEVKITAVLGYARIIGWSFTYHLKEESEKNSMPHKCPEAILKLLSPTENETAQKWRLGCWANIRKEKEGLSLRKLPLGSIISYVSPLEETRYLMKVLLNDKVYWQYNERCYIDSSKIPEDYEVNYVSDGTINVGKVRVLW